uniref:Uncharacterized protein n=1 Tax=Pararge aegeria TaxID=116150 RepID=S4PEI0_9NEOP
MYLLYVTIFTQYSTPLALSISALCTNMSKSFEHHLRHIIIDVEFYHRLKTDFGIDSVNIFLIDELFAKFPSNRHYTKSFTLF